MSDPSQPRSLPGTQPHTVPHGVPRATAAPSPAAADAFHSSGQSPGLPTLHLVGPGRVGRCLLERLADAPIRLVAVTDSTATVFGRRGLDAAALAAHKAIGRAHV